jgi:hypothetical protein
MELPLFQQASRRAFLRTGLTASALLAAGGLLAACGNDDSSALAPSPTTSTGATTGSTAPASSAAPTTAATTKAPATTAGSTATTAGSASGASAAAASVATIAFTYTPSDAGGRARNPFVAVWVEDASKALVSLVNLTYSARDAKYVRELTEFASVATSLTQDEVDAVSAATRSAGAYQLSWSGQSVTGAKLSGPLTLWIEAAREHGPHSVTSGSIDLSKPGAVTIAGSGELSDATVTIA